MIINYDSSIVNKPRASLTDDTRFVIYDRHMFIVQATDVSEKMETLVFSQLFTFFKVRCSIKF